MFHGQLIEDNLSVIQRASVILDAFDYTRPRLCLTKLSDRTGLPKATVHRLLRQLVEAQLLTRVGTEYTPGALISSLAELSPVARLRDNARPHLVELYRRTGQTVHLAVLDGNQVMYVDKVYGRGQQVPTKVGGRQPLYCTALGRAILAQRQEMLEGVIRSGLRPRTPSTVTDTARFRRMITTVATERVAFDRFEHTPGLSCVSAPLGIGHDAVAAISLSSSVSSFRPKDCTLLLLETAAHLSRACADVLHDIAEDPIREA